MQTGRFERKLPTREFMRSKECLAIMDIINGISEEHSQEWTVDQLVNEWRDDDAQLWLCADGFLVTRVIINRFAGNRELFVWVCWSKHPDGLHEYMPDIMTLAKTGQCQTIKFETPRDGFKKIAKEKGWRSMTTYSICVA